jgi:hypothetical protein
MRIADLGRHRAVGYAVRGWRSASLEVGGSGKLAVCEFHFTTNDSVAY